MLNAVELGTVVPIHRHPTKDESFVILRGKVRVTTHNDDGTIIEDVVLRQESGNCGVRRNWVRVLARRRFRLRCVLRRWGGIWRSRNLRGGLSAYRPGKGASAYGEKV